jgi:hypothetical protein
MKPPDCGSYRACGRSSLSADTDGYGAIPLGLGSRIELLPKRPE